MFTTKILIDNPNIITKASIETFKSRFPVASGEMFALSTIMILFFFVRRFDHPRKIKKYLLLCGVHKLGEI